MDIGYASEKVKLYDEKGHSHMIAGQNGKTQLIISAPFINKTFKDELQKIDELLSGEVNENLECHLVMANEASAIFSDLKHPCSCLACSARTARTHRRLQAFISSTQVGESR